MLIMLEESLGRAETLKYGVVFYMRIKDFTALKSQNKLHI